MLPLLLSSLPHESILDDMGPVSVMASPVSWPSVPSEWLLLQQACAPQLCRSEVKACLPGLRLAGVGRSPLCLPQPGQNDGQLINGHGASVRAPCRAPGNHFQLPPPPHFSDKPHLLTMRHVTDQRRTPGMRETTWKPGASPRSRAFLPLFSL